MDLTVYLVSITINIIRMDIKIILISINLLIKLQLMNENDAFIIVVLLSKPLHEYKDVLLRIDNSKIF